MTLGIPTDLFLQIHVLLSLIGIASGLIVLYGLVTGRAYSGWTALFLTTTILTSVTGLPLPPFGFDPPRAVAILSLVLLAAAVLALYAFRPVGPWRWIYIGAAITALYLNVFVGANSIGAAFLGCADRCPRGFRCARYYGSAQVSPRGQRSDVGTTMSLRYQC